MENMNTRKLIPSLAAIAIFVIVSTNANASIALFDYGFNVDGSVTYPFDGDIVPSNIDISAFDDFTGLGTIDVTVSGAGTHYFGAFFDHEIDAPTNTYYNETGSANGAPAAGQSWEIDRPGPDCVPSPPVPCRNGTGGLPYWGDIYQNFEDKILDNRVFYDWFDDQFLLPPDDVSMAIGWDFTLAANEFALIMLVLSDSAPTSGFFLEQHDPDSAKSIYLSGTLNIGAVPLPAAVWLFGTALVGLIGFSRRRKAA